MSAFDDAIDLLAIVYCAALIAIDVPVVTAEDVRQYALWSMSRTAPLMVRAAAWYSVGYRP